MSARKDTDRLVRDLRSEGWAVTKTKGGHWRAKPPRCEHRIVVFGSTPSDRRSLANTKADLRRSGYRPRSAS